MGARSEHIHLWKWSIWNRERGRIIIPKHQTKLKKADVEFNVSQIPFLKNWLWWGWNIDGRPNDNQPICGSGRGITEKAIKKWMNMNREIFSVSHEDGFYDLEKKIDPR